MDFDDIAPNDGALIPREPKEQEVDRKKERAETLQALPVLIEIVKHLTEQVEFYESVDSIPPEVKTDPEKFLIVHNANELTRNNLRAELEWVEELLSQHAKNKI